MDELDLTLTRIIRAPRERVFAAWTDPVLLVQWWGPGQISCPEAEVDLREGGAYRLANLEADGSITWIYGEFRLVRPPEELAYTWAVTGVAERETLVSVRFNDHPEGTELVIRHSRFGLAPVRSMHLVGWNGCIDKLEAMFGDQAGKV